MKHVGKLKNNGAKVYIAYRTLPGDPYHALVVNPTGLTEMHRENLQTLVESFRGQEANELADTLAAKRFNDGSPMLTYLHRNNHLSKVSTSNVLVTPSSNVSIPLNELNVHIASQKGVTLAELSIKDDSNHVVATINDPNTAVPPVSEVSDTPTVEVKPVKNTPAVFELTPEEMLSRADALELEVSALRAKARSQMPPVAMESKASLDATETQIVDSVLSDYALTPDTKVKAAKHKKTVSETPTE